MPDRDYFSCPESEIADITADLTVVGGKIVHAAGDFAKLDRSAAAAGRCRIGCRSHRFGGYGAWADPERTDYEQGDTAKRLSVCGRPTLVTVTISLRCGAPRPPAGAADQATDANDEGRCDRGDRGYCGRQCVACRWRAEPRALAGSRLSDHSTIRRTSMSPRKTSIDSWRASSRRSVAAPLEARRVHG